MYKYNIQNLNIPQNFSDVHTKLNEFSTKFSTKLILTSPIGSELTIAHNFFALMKKICYDALEIIWDSVV